MECFGKGLEVTHCAIGNVTYVLFNFNRDSVHLVPFLRYGELFVESRRYLHHLHLAPPVGVIPGLASLVEHRLVTDTERQTNTGPWHIPQ